MYVFMYVCIYVCMYVWMYVCMYITIYVCKYVAMYICMWMYAGCWYKLFSLSDTMDRRQLGIFMNT